MNISKEVSHNSIKLFVSGRVGNATSHEFQKILLDTFQITNKVILDFANLEYINSTGLRALLLAMQRAEEIKGKLVVKNVSNEVMELFKITGFDDMLYIV